MYKYSFLLNFIIPTFNKYLPYVPALFGLIRHPKKGVVLFDTGHATRFIPATKPWPYRIYRWLTPTHISEEEDAIAEQVAGLIYNNAKSSTEINYDHYQFSVAQNGIWLQCTCKTDQRECLELSETG